MRGRINRTRMAANIATTPPSLLGMDRKMAYAHRKYHSGIICTGVTKGLAGRKFSGSPRILGKNSATHVKVIKNTTNPTASFVV